MKKTLIIVLSIAIVLSIIIITLITTVVLPRTVFKTFKDPTGEYTAIVSYRSYLSHIPMMPGSSSDKPGFIKIIDSSGKNYGEMPLPMLQMVYDMSWTKNGAEVMSGLIGEWNFKEDTCWYWNEAQTSQKTCSR